MAAASLSDVANVAVQDFEMELTTLIELALPTAVRDERLGIAECTRRGQLWEMAAERADASEPLRVEAHSPASEARYLADLTGVRR